MKNAIVRLLMPFLLLAQVGAGMSPGRVLCIASACCSADRSGHIDHDGHHHHAHDLRHHGDHRHAVGCDHDAILAAQPDCDCHIHIVLPDDAGTSRDRTADRIADARLMQPALIEHPPEPRATSGHAVDGAPARWCWDACDQCRARAVTRLLI